MCHYLLAMNPHIKQLWFISKALSSLQHSHLLSQKLSEKISVVLRHLKSLLLCLPYFSAKTIETITQVFYAYNCKQFPMSYIMVFGRFAADNSNCQTGAKEEIQYKSRI